MEENKGWIKVGKSLLSHPWIESAITLVAIVMQFTPIHPVWTNSMLVVALGLIVISTYRLNPFANKKVWPRLLITAGVAVVVGIFLYA